MEKFAIIETGGKQYKVDTGKKLKIEKVKGSAQKDESGLVFDKVLLLVQGDDVKIGTPYVSGAVVHGKLLKQGREKKKIVFKYKSKTRERKKKGHRQHYTEAEITKV